jgi:hypothetical protein
MSDETNNTELQPVNTQVVPVESSSSEDVSQKSRLCALLLGIFLGHLGIHNFYLGRIGRGLAQCLLRVFGFIFYMVGLFATVFANEHSYSFHHNGLSAAGVIFAAFLIVSGVIMLLVPGIWALVEWIKVACGKARDGKGLLVKVWVNED